MAKILAQGIRREIILEEQRYKKQREWPYSESPICCPTCCTVFEIDASKNFNHEVMVCDTQGYIQKVDAWVRCPNCHDSKLFGWNISLERRPKFSLRRALFGEIDIKHDEWKETRVFPSR